METMDIIGPVLLLIGIIIVSYLVSKITKSKMYDVVMLFLAVFSIAGFVMQIAMKICG